MKSHCDSRKASAESMLTVAKRRNASARAHAHTSSPWVLVLQLPAFYVAPTRAEVAWICDYLPLANSARLSSTKKVEQVEAGIFCGH